SGRTGSPLLPSQKPFACALRPRGTSRRISGAAGSPRYPEFRFLLLWVKLQSCVGWLYAYTDYLYLPQRVMTCADREIRFAECQAFFCNKCVTSVEFIKSGSMRFDAQTCVID